MSGGEEGGKYIWWNLHNVFSKGGGRMEKWPYLADKCRALRNNNKLGLFLTKTPRCLGFLVFHILCMYQSLQYGPGSRQLNDCWSNTLHTSHAHNKSAEKITLLCPHWGPYHQYVCTVRWIHFPLFQPRPPGCLCVLLPAGLKPFFAIACYSYFTTWKGYTKKKFFAGNHGSSYSPVWTHIATRPSPHHYSI